MKVFTTTESLVRACVAGEEDAWTALVRRFAPVVRGIARSYGLNAADCEDVAQATWVRLWQHLDGLRQPERLAEWLSVVARRESLRFLNVSSRHVPTDDDATLDPPARRGISAEDEVLSGERDERLRRAFRLLPPRCQAMLSMLMDERSYAEVSTALGLASGSVGPIRSRCLANLRELIEQVSEPVPGNAVTPLPRRASSSRGRSGLPCHGLRDARDLLEPPAVARRAG